MEEFVESLKDSNPLKHQHDVALNTPKPFSKFKFIIDNFAGDYRQKRFDFKNVKLMKSVRGEIKRISED